MWLEPVGSVAPKLNSREMKIENVYMGQSFTIIANVQGYPVPAYLWVIYKKMQHFQVLGR